MNNAQNAAAKLSTPELHHIASALEAELLEHSAAGVAGTQAHVGMLEMLEACSRELHRRGGLGL